MSLVAAFLAASSSVGVSPIGYSGLLNVPTAQTRQDLGLSFNWMDAQEPLLQFIGTSNVNRTYGISLPLFPFVEISMSFLQVIGWYDPEVPLLPYTVHRTIAIKGRLPLDWAGPQLAGGIIDPVSANFLATSGTLNTHYGLTTGYLVATQQLGPLSITAGYGNGDTLSGKWGRTKPFLHGIFGGAELALPLGLDLMGEYDGLTTNVGGRLSLLWGITLQGGYAGGGWTAGTAVATPL
jgi:hypothetical protein